MLRHKIYLLVTLLLPLLSFFLFVSIFEKGVARDLPVAVVDHDNSALSRQFIRSLDGTSEIHISHEATSLNEGKELIQHWKCSGLLFIGKDFEKKSFRGEAPGVVLYTNNINLSTASTISKAVKLTAGTLGTRMKVALRTQKGEMVPQAIQGSQPVKLNTHVLYNPYVSYFIFMVSALLPLMLQMFVLLTTIYAIGIELKQHTAGHWMKLAKHNSWIAVTGKLLPYTVLFSCLGIFMNILTFNYLKIPLLGNAWMIHGGTLLFVLSYQAMGILFISIRANMRESLSLGMAFSSMAFSFSGLTFPHLGMPGSMQFVATLFPYTHYLQLTINQALKGIPASYSFSHLLLLIGFIIIPAMGFFRLQKALRDETKWGKH
jgi:ABC-2 type transport system permease protein